MNMSGSVHPPSSTGLRSVEEGPAILQQALDVQLKIPAEQLDLDASLLQLGLDSIDLMSWLHRFHAEGVELSLRDLYRRPSVNGWLAMLRKGRPCHVPIADSVRCWGTMRVGEAFPLTPVQLAYLAGRSPQQVLGGVGCYLYQEFDGTGLDPERLDSALQCTPSSDAVGGFPR